MRAYLCLAVTIATAVPAAAQERPFLFSIATTPDAKPAVRVDYDVAVGERAFQSDSGNEPEQRIGVQASRGRLTFLGRFGIADVGSAYHRSQSGEILYSLLGSRSPLYVAAGGGLLHEPGGANVLLGRITAARETDTWKLHGNVVFQKPIASDRDTVDLVTSVGWARDLSRAVALGVEAVGEDLEGFWEGHEAEGGARLLVGPSVHVAPAGRRWQLNATGGPLFHPSNTSRSSDAFRDLPPETTRVSYALKIALSISLVNAR